MIRIFTIEQRERVRERLLELARADPRVVAAAAVGGSISGGERPLVRPRPDLRGRRKLLAGGRARGLDADGRPGIRGRSPFRPASWLGDLPGLPASRMRAGGHLVRAGRRLRGDRPAVRAALRPRGRQGSDSDAAPERDLRAGGAPRRSSPVLPSSATDPGKPSSDSAPPATSRSSLRVYDAVWTRATGESSTSSPRASSTRSTARWCGRSTAKRCWPRWPSRSISCCASRPTSGRS